MSNKVKRLRNGLLTLLGSVICIVLDQWLKHLVVLNLKPINVFQIWEGVFQLTYVENHGAAFGIFAGEKILLVWITGFVIALMILLILLGKIRHPCLLVSFSLIIGGGIGNLIDRIANSYVVDYLHVTLIHFAVFNFADCCVVIGTILLLIYFLFIDRDDSKKKKASDEQKSENINA